LPTGKLMATKCRFAVRHSAYLIPVLWQFPVLLIAISRNYYQINISYHGHVNHVGMGLPGLFGSA
ncbi:MAG: hypothetical protein RSF79_06330, partial [Janthinobacterium sp.]